MECFVLVRRQHELYSNTVNWIVGEICGLFGESPTIEAAVLDHVNALKDDFLAQDTANRY